MHAGGGRGGSEGRSVGGLESVANIVSLPPLPSVLLSKHSARAEWKEWWKGWLQRSGAFPLRSAWLGSVVTIEMRLELVELEIEIEIEVKMRLG